MNKRLIFTAANLLLRPLFHLISPKAWLRSRSRRLGLRHLDLGGMWPAEGYVSVRLSPFDFYGVPTTRWSSKTFQFDSARSALLATEHGFRTAGLSISYNVSNGLPFDDNTIGGINLSHMLEHFTRSDGLRLLVDCRRVLEPNGVLRISCPDLKRYATAYSTRDRAFFERADIRWADRYRGLETLGDRFIGKAYDNDLNYGHKWFYDAESAIQLVREAGFVCVEERMLHQSTLPNIEAVEPTYRAAESFYVEAYKYLEIDVRSNAHRFRHHSKLQSGQPHWTAGLVQFAS